MINLSEKFNDDTKNYKKLRPTYPDSLFQWIHHIALEKELALDCGTGNGQAANKLTPYFKRIIAIDSSQNQIEIATPHPKIDYYCISAEDLSLNENSIDVITCASSVHWFNLKKFYMQCRRILKKNGAVIFFTYTWPSSSNRLVDQVLTDIKHALMPFFPKESRYHIDKYATLPFPFKEITPPSLFFTQNWMVDELMRFFSTWVFIKQYETTHKNFLSTFRSRLLNCCKGTEIIEFIFPLYIRAGTL